MNMPVCGGADKFLARPGRKQASDQTRYLLNILPTKINTLLSSLLCRKPLKKCPSNQVSAAAITSSSDEKWRVQGTDGSPTGTDTKNRVVDQDTGSPGRPVSSGLQVQCSHSSAPIFTQIGCDMLQRSRG